MIISCPLPVGITETTQQSRTSPTIVGFLLEEPVVASQPHCIIWKRNFLNVLYGLCSPKIELYSESQRGADGI